MCAVNMRRPPVWPTAVNPSHNRVRCRRQVGRISPGGDHHDLLGIAEAGGVSAVVDAGQLKTGLRMRAGGRAATLFAGDAYGFAEAGGGSMVADRIDVKGLGTHVSFASKKVSHTGLLGQTDALRELAVQQLVQRICDLETGSGGTLAASSSDFTPLDTAALVKVCIICVSLPQFIRPASASALALALALASHWPTPLPSVLNCLIA